MVSITRHVRVSVSGLGSTPTSQILEVTFRRDFVETLIYRHNTVHGMDTLVGWTTNRALYTGGISRSDSKIGYALCDILVTTFNQLRYLADGNRFTYTHVRDRLVQQSG